MISDLDPNCRGQSYDTSQVDLYFRISCSGRISRYRLHSRRDTSYEPVAGQTEIAKMLDQEEKESQYVLKQCAAVHVRVITQSPADRITTHFTWPKCCQERQNVCCQELLMMMV